MNDYEDYLVERALHIAYSAHRGQVDKSGKPYIFHPITLSSQLSDPVEMSIALLHDTIEDTYIDAEELERRGIPEEVIAAVFILTRDKNKETYFEYIDRVANATRTVRKIKLLDLKHNMDLSRLKDVNDKARSLQKRYLKAWGIIVKTFTIEEYRQLNIKD